MKNSLSGSRNLSFLGFFNPAAASGTLEVFLTTFRLKQIFLVSQHGVKSPLLADLIQIRPKGIVFCSAGT